jgi:hypothetical protein
MGEIVNIILAVLTPVTAWFTGKRDRPKVYEWLRENTRDYPGESHTDTATIAKGTRLSEERVRRACMTDERVYRLGGRLELWSVWRQEPQSIYEKRGF